MRPMADANVRTSDVTKDLWSAFALALAEIDQPARSGWNDFHQYGYSTLEDYLNAIQVPLRERGLMLLYSVVSVVELPDGKTRKGQPTHRCRVTMTLRLQHTGGQWCEVDVVGDADDGEDKGVGKAMTSARKAGIANLFAFGGMAGDRDQGGDADRRRETRTPAKAADDGRGDLLAELRSLMPILAKLTGKTPVELAAGWCKAAKVDAIDKLTTKRLQVVVDAARSKVEKAERGE